MARWIAVLLRERGLLNDDRQARHVDMLEQPVGFPLRPLKVFRAVMETNPILASLPGKDLRALDVNKAMHY